MGVLGDFHHFILRKPNPRSSSAAIGFRKIGSGPRRALAWRVMNALLSFNSKAPEITVQVADLSRSGMRIYVDARIARGTAVHIQYQDVVAQGIVWHSRKFKEMYSIGIAFQAVAGPRVQTAVRDGADGRKKVCMLEPDVICR